METEQARKEAEALRYRLLVRVALVLHEAERQRRPDLVESARMLQREIETIEVGDDESIEHRATDALLAHRAKIDQLQQEVGLPEHGMQPYPKWLRFAGWAAPLIVILGLIAWIIERRRKKKEISAKDLERLETGSQ